MKCPSTWCHHHPQQAPHSDPKLRRHDLTVHSLSTSQWFPSSWCHSNRVNTSRICKEPAGRQIHCRFRWRVQLFGEGAAHGNERTNLMSMKFNDSKDGLDLVLFFRIFYFLFSIKFASMHSGRGNIFHWSSLARAWLSGGLVKHCMLVLKCQGVPTCSNTWDCKVTAIKLDPYINIDAGLMSPTFGCKESKDCARQKFRCWQSVGRVAAKSVLKSKVRAWRGAATNQALKGLCSLTLVLFVDLFVDL